MNIYAVKVCKFVSEEKQDKVFRLNRSEFVTHYCVVDFSDLVATDIFTCEQFRLLSKNVEGKILSSEKVELNKNYAVYFESLDLNKLTVWNLWKVKLACFRFDLLRKVSNKLLTGQKQNMLKR